MAVELGSDCFALLKLRLCEFGGRVYREVIDVIANLHLSTAAQHDPLTISVDFSKDAWGGGFPHNCFDDATSLQECTHILIRSIEAGMCQSQLLLNYELKNGCYFLDGLARCQSLLACLINNLDGVRFQEGQSPAGVLAVHLKQPEGTIAMQKHHPP